MSSITRNMLSLLALSALVGGLVACGGDADAPVEVARLTAGEVAARPLQDAPYPTDAVPAVEIVDAAAAELEARERELAERELALREADIDRREAELARRERAVVRPAPARAPERRAPAEPVTAREQVVERVVEPAPRPAPRRVVDVPAGTSIAARLDGGLGSDTSQVGDAVSARVLDDVWADGVVAIPAGSTLQGTVSDAQGLRRVGGRARLAVDFHNVTLPDGESASLAARYQASGRSETRRDAPTIVGSAVGGAVLGNVLGKRQGRDRTKAGAVGAAVGAAVGTVIAARTDGEEVVLPAGSDLDLTLEAPVSVTVRG